MFNLLLFLFTIKAELPNLVPIERIVQNPALKEESPSYVKTRKIIEKENLMNLTPPIKYKEQQHIPEDIDFLKNLLNGNETFLDRIRARVKRNRYRSLYKYA